jgi:hypothetical protein
MLVRFLLCTAVVTLTMTGIAAAQQNLPAVTQQTATIKRTPLQKFDVPGTNYETVIGMAETVPNVNIGRHDNILPGHFLTFPECARTTHDAGYKRSKVRPCVPVCETTVVLERFCKPAGGTGFPSRRRRTMISVAMTSCSLHEPLPTT